MVAEEWTPDDSAVPDDAPLLRMIRNRPKYVTHPDSITGRPYATGVALQIDDNSGLSVHEADLLEEHYSISRSAYFPDEFLLEFQPAVARAVDPAWGVVLDPDPDDPDHGAAHALVRGPSPKPSKSCKEALREAINRECLWHRSPVE